MYSDYANFLNWNQINVLSANTSVIGAFTIEAICKTIILNDVLTIYSVFIRSEISMNTILTDWKEW